VLDPRSSCSTLPGSYKQEVLTVLFETYQERASERRLGSYMEILHDVGADELEAASRLWRRLPHTRAPSPGELLAYVASMDRPPTAP
jgi:hypothetical protein